MHKVIYFTCLCLCTTWYHSDE